MAVNIGQTRSDMLRRQSDFETSQKWETREFVSQAVVALAASLGAGAALANWVNSRPVPAPQPPQIIYLQPAPAAPPIPAR